MQKIVSVDNEVILIFEALRKSYPERAEEVKVILRSAGMTEKEIDASLKMKVGRPDAAPPSEYPMLDASFRPATPMLRARYSFASSIVDVAWRFPSMKDLTKLLASKKLKAVAASQRESWDGSAPDAFDESSISLFAYTNLDDGDVAWLVWNKGDEPEVWTYQGQRENKYKNIKEFISYIMS